MAQSFIINLASSRIDDANLLIFTSGDQLRPVPIPAGTEYNVWMTVNVDQDLAGTNIPDNYLIVRAGSEKNIQSRWMPQN